MQRSIEFGLSILEPIKIVTLDSSPEFIAKNCFQEGFIDGMYITMLLNFKNNFFEKIETNLETTYIQSYRIKIDCPPTTTVIKALGEGYETKLGYLWQLLKKDIQNPDGMILSKGVCNVFFIRDANETLWVVLVEWKDIRGWYIEALRPGSPLAFRGLIYRWVFGHLN